MRKQLDREIMQKAADFLVPIYALTNKFPPDEIQVRVSQVRADAVAILLNFAEALGSEDEKDLQQFVDSALAAARSCVTELRLAQRLEVCCPEQLEQVRAQAEEIVRLLTGLKTSRWAAT
jgi:four helix bundle protein